MQKPLTEVLGDAGPLRCSGITPNMFIHEHADGWRPMDLKENAQTNSMTKLFKYTVGIRGVSWGGALPQ